MQENEQKTTLIPLLSKSALRQMEKEHASEPTRMAGHVAEEVHRKELTFTLSELVDYCKDRVSWEDARPIVGMLNQLIRGCATKEDMELVDSVEEEFRRRNGVGIRVKKAEIEVTSPGNYIARNIIKQYRENGRDQEGQ